MYCVNETYTMKKKLNVTLLDFKKAFDSVESKPDQNFNGSQYTPKDNKYHCKNLHK